MAEVATGQTDQRQDAPAARPLAIADRLSALAVVAAGAFVALMLFLEARHEPYHIDELRQVRPYHRPWGDLVDASFSQDQPPLDVLVGAQLQNILGRGDLNNRGSSMLAGLGIVAVLSALLWRRQHRAAIPVTLVVLGLSPAFLSFTAYARPYALPMFLILLHAWMADVWLNRGSRAAAAVLFGAALLLPLSRVFEPPAYLVFVAIAAVVFGRWRAPQWGRRVWFLPATTLLALLIVELPVYRRLEEQLTAYQGEGAASLADQWSRIIDDSIPRFAGVFENGWIALAVVVLALVRGRVRDRLATLWWFWPLLATAAAFAVTFHYRTLPGQPFYDRYGYFWLVPFAIIVGLLMEDLIESLRDRRPSTFVAGGVVGALMVALGLGVVEDLSTPDRTDYRALGELVEADHPVSTDVIFDTVAYPLGRYRPGYAGYGRYTAVERQMIKAEIIHIRPDAILDDNDYLVATAGPVVEVEGWNPVSASDDMTLYVPEQYPRTAVEVAQVLIQFGEAAPASQGGVFRIAGAIVLAHNHELPLGCAALGDLIAEDPSLKEAAGAAVSRSPVSAAFSGCPGGNPIG